jgi:hypothetical protein
VVPTTGDGQEVRLPGDDVEHASNGDACKSAVEATQAKVDGVKGCGNAECWERRRQVSVLSRSLFCLPEICNSSQSSQSAILLGIQLIKIFFFW